MKKLLISAGAVTALALSTPAFAQSASNQATANATVNIVSPLSVTKVTDLDFGTVVAPSGGFVGGETVEIDNAGGQNCSGTLTCSGSPSAASFTVAGTAGQALVYNIDSNVTLAGPGSPATDITVDTTVAGDRTEPATTGTGSVTLVVGGRISLGASQPDGVYNGTLNVQADYQ